MAGFGAYAWVSFPSLGTPEEVFGRRCRGWSGAGCRLRWRRRCLRSRPFKRAENELASIRGIENCRLVSRNDPEYPRTLLQIYDPPVLLYVRGACKC